MQNHKRFLEHTIESVFLISLLQTLHIIYAEQEDWRHHPIYYNTKTGVPIPLLHQEENLSNNGLIISYGRAPCTCVAWDCNCCTDIIFDAIKFRERGCFQFGYNLKLEKIKVKLLMNDSSVVESDVNDDGPPPFCLPNKTSDSLEMCAKVSNLTFPGPGRNIQFCLNFETHHSSHTFILKFECTRFGDDGFHSFNPDEPEILVTTIKPPSTSTTAASLPFEENIDMDLAFNRFIHNDSRPVQPSKPFLPLAIPAGTEVAVTNFVLAAKPSGFVLRAPETESVPDRKTSGVNLVQLPKIRDLVKQKDQSSEESRVSSMEVAPDVNFSFGASGMTGSGFTGTGFSSPDEQNSSSAEKRPFDDPYMEFDMFANRTQPNGSYSEALKTFQEPEKGSKTTESPDLGELEEVFVDNPDELSNEAKHESNAFRTVPYDPKYIESVRLSGTTVEKPTNIQKIPFRKTSNR